jgi:hypothetical protein
MGASLAKLQPETDPIKKLDAEIEGFRSKAEANFREVGASAASALQTSAALIGLENYEKKLDSLKVKLESDILAKQALEVHTLPGGQPTGTTVPGISSAAAPVVPTLGAGGTTGAQLDSFAKDTAAQQNLVKQVFQDSVTPAQELALKIEELRIAFNSLPEALRTSTQAQQAFDAELAKLEQGTTRAQLHLQEMSKQLENLLSHSTSAEAGVQAFFLQLSVESAQNGKFAFDILTQGLKGFEDEVTKAIFTGKAHWKDYFRSLAEEAFKFMLNKEIASMFQMLSGSGIGKSLGLDKLIPSAGQAGQSAALTTNTTALATNTTALTTLTARLSIGGGAGGGVFGFGGGSGSGGSDADGGDIGEFASGTDSAPGGFAWVGEHGPELVNLPGGSSVTPTESLRSGGDSHYYDMRGAVVTEDLMRKADFARAMSAAKPALIGEAVANFNEIQMRTAGRGR